MNENLLKEPIFFIGMPRSGTTIIFEAVGRHPELAWLSNYSQKNPRHPLLNILRILHENRFFVVEARKRQYGKTPFCNRYLVKPAEAYQFWDYYSRKDFSYDALVNSSADRETALNIRKAVEKTVRYQGRTRFSTKLTGPPRTHFIRSVFPDAKFVHVIREGLAVVHSLLNVAFWGEQGGFDRPFWKGVLRNDEIELWQKQGRDPGVITAMQWNRIMQMTREEADLLGSEHLLEVKYEDFIDSPHKTLKKIFSFCNLPDAGQAHASLDHGPKLVSMNKKFEKDWGPEYIRILSDIMGPSLEVYGYVLSR